MSTGHEVMRVGLVKVLRVGIVTTDAVLIARAYPASNALPLAS